MALPSNVNKVTVHGKYLQLDGTPVEGKLTFSIQPVLVDPTATPLPVTIIPKSIIVNLDNQGEFSVDLPATDDADLVGGPFIYTVVEGWSGGRTFTMSVPLSAQGTGIDMVDIAPVSSPDPTAATTFVLYSTFSALAARVKDILILSAAAPVPNGTPVNTIIVRTTT